MRAPWIVAIALGACGGQIDTGGGDDMPPGGNPDGNNGGGGDAEIPGGVGEPANLTGITLFHNQVRAGVQTDNPLPFLTWNADLAATAQAWAEQCVDNEAPTGLINHNAGRSNGHPYYVGENIYGSGGGGSAQEAVELWASEGANYNYANNSCSGGTCGHYTQLVWRATLEVGCALHTCAGLQFGASIVCDYGPGGNSGGKPY